MREALYWLRLAQEAEVVISPQVTVLTAEANELAAILTSSIKTAREREGTRVPSRRLSTRASKRH